MNSDHENLPKAEKGECGVLQLVESGVFGEPLIGIYPPGGCSITGDVPLSKTWGGEYFQSGAGAL